MYRGIAHSGLSRIPTSRHVSIRINPEYGCGSYRRLSSSTRLWSKAPPWSFRGNKTAREKAQVDRVVHDQGIKDRKAGYTKSTDPAWESIPPPTGRRMGRVDFRAKPPNEGTALTGSETSFIWGNDKDGESNNVGAVLPASAVLGRLRPDQMVGRDVEKTEVSGKVDGSNGTNPPISWATSLHGARPWSDNPDQVSWKPPKIRTHLSDVPPALEVPVETKRVEKAYTPPRFRSHAMGQTKRDDYDTRLEKWPNQTYSALDEELEPWNGEQSELAESGTDKEHEDRRKYLSEYDARPNFRTYAASRHNGVFDDDGREEMTILKKPARVLPYSSASSEFLYGYNICKLALKEKRRKIYKLYVYTGLMRQSGTIEKENILRYLAADSKLQVVSTMDVGLLDAMSKGRPHNGFALETEPLETPKVGHLVTPTNLGVFNAPVYQSPQYVQIKIKGKDRRPFVLVLDEILDGGNFGAILRSAYFLGVDAVFIVSKNSTPATAVTSRSSAGALECIDYYDVGHLPSFISRSQEYGWKFFGAMPSPSQNVLKASKTSSKKWYDMEGLGDPTSRSPVALVLGNEAEGLRPSIQKMMDAFVTIRRADEVDVVVDSLNVGVAASILTHAFLYPAVKGAESEWAKDRRTERKEAKVAAEAVEGNMLFQIDDGKYTVPRYEGVNKIETTTFGNAAGGAGEKPDLLAGLEDQEVEEDPLKGWNPDDDVDETWEEMEENEVVDEKGDEGLEERQIEGEDEMKGFEEDEGEWEDEIDDPSLIEALEDVHAEMENKGVFKDGEARDKELLKIEEAIMKGAHKAPAKKEGSKELQGSEELERKMAADVASEFVLDISGKSRSDDEILDSTEDIPEEVPEVSTAEESTAEAEMEIGEELDWEDIHEIVDKGIEGQKNIESEETLKEKAAKSRYDWDIIKPQEIDFAAGLVGPAPVILPAGEVPKKKKPEKKVNPNQILPKRIKEVMEAKGIKLTGTVTKKQKKMLKKESKKMHQELRKKVRDDASAVREALQNNHDPKVLQQIHGQSVKRNSDVNRDKNEERRKQVEEKKEEKMGKLGGAKGKAGKLKQRGKDKTDYVKAGTWSVSEVLQ
ncbi:hypothetical protein TWF506_007394 [Arthrobotrys conoides]|uniref:rRNA methyltransferase 1, mitochondrial n=1 Tax=Arthrobotrys conoides TaxID=74498 RepID=A0AAN8NPP1_9PEZI